jgi:hypothetical protein
MGKFIAVSGFFEPNIGILRYKQKVCRRLTFLENRGQTRVRPRFQLAGKRIANAKTAGKVWIYKMVFFTVNAPC